MSLPGKKLQKGRTPDMEIMNQMFENGIHLSIRFDGNLLQASRVVCNAVKVSVWFGI
jgi:hypothetical protein